jgi:hypothetical protein
MLSAPNWVEDSIMAVREIGDWMLFSAAIELEAGSRSYRPGVTVRRKGHLDGPTYLLDQHAAHGVTEDEAHRLANAYMLTVTHVTDEGRLWDRPAD